MASISGFWVSAIGAAILLMIALLMALEFMRNDDPRGRHARPLLFAITIVAIKLVFGFLPRYIKSNERLMSLANCLSAGVFISAGLVHMLPESVTGFTSREDFSVQHSDVYKKEHAAGHELKLELEHKHKHGVSSAPFLLCAVGFFMTFFLEKVVYLTDTDKDDEGEEPQGHETEPINGTPLRPRVSMCNTDGYNHRAGACPVISAIDEGCAHSHAHSHDHIGLLRTVSLSPEGAPLPAMALVLTIILSVHSLVGGLALGVSQIRSCSLFFVGIWNSSIEPARIHPVRLFVLSLVSGCVRSAHLVYSMLCSMFRVISSA